MAGCAIYSGGREGEGFDSNFGGYGVGYYEAEGVAAATLTLKIAGRLCCCCSCDTVSAIRIHTRKRIRIHTRIRIRCVQALQSSGAMTAAR